MGCGASQVALAEEPRPVQSCPAIPVLTRIPRLVFSASSTPSQKPIWLLSGKVPLPSSCAWAFTYQNCRQGATHYLLGQKKRAKVQPSTHCCSKDPEQPKKTSTSLQCGILVWAAGEGFPVGWIQLGKQKVPQTVNVRHENSLVPLKLLSGPLFKYVRCFADREPLPSDRVLFLPQFFLGPTSAWFSAILNSDRDAIEKLVHHCPNVVNLRDAFGSTALHVLLSPWSTVHNQTELIGLLLRLNAPLFARNSAGQTCFHLAAKYSSEPVCALLLEAAGKDKIIDAVDCSGASPLQYALEVSARLSARGAFRFLSERNRIVLLFVANGADPSRVMPHSDPPITLGAFAVRAFPTVEDCVRAHDTRRLQDLACDSAFCSPKSDLLGSKCHEDGLSSSICLDDQTGRFCQNFLRWTALHEAVMIDDAHSLRILLQSFCSSVNIESMTDAGESPATLALRLNRKECLLLLLESGAQLLQTVDRNFRNAFHKAFWSRKSSKILPVILSLPDDDRISTLLVTPDADAVTPLQLAVSPSLQLDETEIIELFCRATPRRIVAEMSVPFRKSCFRRLAKLDISRKRISKPLVLANELLSICVSRGLHNAGQWLLKNCFPDPTLLSDGLTSPLKTLSRSTTARSILVGASLFGKAAEVWLGDALTSFFHWSDANQDFEPAITSFASHSCMRSFLREWTLGKNNSIQPLWSLLWERAIKWQRQHPTNEKLWFMLPHNMQKVLQTIFHHCNFTKKEQATTALQALFFALFGKCGRISNRFVSWCLGIVQQAGGNIILEPIPFFARKPLVFCSPSSDISVATQSHLTQLVSLSPSILHHVSWLLSALRMGCTSFFEQAMSHPNFESLTVVHKALLLHEICRRSDLTNLPCWVVEHLASQEVVSCILSKQPTSVVTAIIVDEMSASFRKELLKNQLAALLRLLTVNFSHMSTETREQISEFLVSERKNFVTKDGVLPTLRLVAHFLTVAKDKTLLSFASEFPSSLRLQFEDCIVTSAVVFDYVPFLSHFVQSQGQHDSFSRRVGVPLLILACREQKRRCLVYLLSILPNSFLSLQDASGSTVMDVIAGMTWDRGFRVLWRHIKSHSFSTCFFQNSLSSRHGSEVSRMLAKTLSHFTILGLSCEVSRRLLLWAHTLNPDSSEQNLCSLAMQTLLCTPTDTETWRAWLSCLHEVSPVALGDILVTLVRRNAPARSVRSLLSFHGVALAACRKAPVLHWASGSNHVELVTVLLAALKAETRCDALLTIWKNSSEGDVSLPSLVKSVGGAVRKEFERVGLDPEVHLD